MLEKAICNVLLAGTMMFSNPVSAQSQSSSDSSEMRPPTVLRVYQDNLDSRLLAEGSCPPYLPSCKQKTQQVEQQPVQEQSPSKPAPTPIPTTVQKEDSLEDYLVLVHQKQGYSVCFDANENRKCDDPRSEPFLPNPNDGTHYWKLKTKKEILEYALNNLRGKRHSPKTEEVIGWYYNAYSLKRIEKLEELAKKIPSTTTPAPKSPCPPYICKSKVASSSSSSSSSRSGSYLPSTTTSPSNEKNEKKGRNRSDDWLGYTLMGMGTLAVVIGIAIANAEACYSYDGGGGCTKPMELPGYITLGVGAASFGTGLILLFD